MGMVSSSVLLDCLLDMPVDCIRHEKVVRCSFVWAWLVHVQPTWGWYFAGSWRAQRGNPFPAPPPIDCMSPLLGLTPGPLAPGCRRNANSTGSSALAAATPPAPVPAAPVALELAGPSPGPRRISSSRPRSRHAGSFFTCVARWMPNAAC